MYKGNYDMPEWLHKWETIIMGLIILPFAALIKWSLGAWMKTISRKEAVDVVTASLKNCSLIEDQFKSNMEEKLNGLNEGHQIILKEVQVLGNRVVRIETVLNGSIPKWDNKTERRKS
jgi:hypothetical protein